MAVAAGAIAMQYPIPAFLKMRIKINFVRVFYFLPLINGVFSCV